MRGRLLLERGWGGWLVRHGYVSNTADAERLNASGSNAFVQSLGQSAELMGSMPIGHANNGGLCERGSTWDVRVSRPQPSTTLSANSLAFERRAVQVDAEALGVAAYSLLRVNQSAGAPHALGAANQFHVIGANDVTSALSVVVTYAWQQILLNVPWMFGRLCMLALLVLALLALRELKRADEAKVLAARRRKKDDDTV